MAAGLESDFKIYQEQFAGRVNELLAQQGNVFNAASNGALRLTTQSRRGDYVYNSLFSNVSGIAARRDLTSLSTVTDTKLSQTESIAVKVSRKIIPIGMTRDAFRKAFGGYSQAEFTDIVAEQAANAMQIEMCDTALLAVRAALKVETGSYYTETSMGSISSQTLVNMLKKMGDRADRVVCWVMHSKAYYDLVLSQISANITPLSNFNIATGTPVTLNRPVIITDSASLKTQLNSPDVDNYFTLGLTAGAVEVENSESQEVVVQDVTGLENLVVRFQGEYAYNVGIKGFQYDVSGGAANPSSTTIGTGSNWDKILTDVKDRAGVVAATL
jgi:Major capsid protein 13-like